MPRVAIDDNQRMNLRIQPAQKAMLLRAAALTNTDLTDFVVQHAVREAAVVIEHAEHLKLSERDSLRVLDMLEHPPMPNARLLAAAKALPAMPA
ncbi:DUF1778 domain-containing protein [Pseudorhodoferax sp. LjRoot39]|uniref:type II toxin-antitoxin system TacA family antitoxin n=1 Tax=Pseudorhodoferax sp. LjRoot39 TaxID=3342328 RepID=UPI003ECC9520